MSAKCGAVFKVVPAILTCAALAFPAGAAAPDREGAIAAERSWVAALNAGDVPALEKILGDDFQDVSWRGGLRRKADMLAALRSGQVHVNEISEVEAVTYDRIAIVRGVDTGRDKDGKIAGRVRFTDVFAFRDGRWIAVGAQETVIAQ